MSNKIFRVTPMIDPYRGHAQRVEARSAAEAVAAWSAWWDATRAKTIKDFGSTVRVTVETNPDGDVDDYVVDQLQVFGTVDGRYIVRQAR